MRVQYEKPNHGAKREGSRGHRECADEPILRADFGHSDAYHRHKRSNRWPSLFESYAITKENVAAVLVQHQCAYPADLSKVFEQAMRRCPSISIKEDVMEGQPCIDGTRIPVRSVIRAVEQYGSIEGALTCYPYLNSDHVKDALYFSQVIMELPGGID